ncbi:methyltransferase [Ruminococcus sp. OA3]|uniref:TRM11 family SAM-dependent methyltransferase n=1 Tax=Ruminococcus sp. OA3 TaxID=2914164 RepID=UPI001F06D179|nr:methyltransferase [Ruminococcus sp. OA3]MCH1981541.1 methyltransferase [Ruminococcus sp. OA3]
MIRTYWNQIMENQEVRQNLSRLRQELKKDGNRARMIHVIEGNEDRLADLLNAEDAKTRKNAALLMGDLGKQEFLQPVYNAYEKEQQRFARSSYLTAMRNFDCKDHLEMLKARLEVLSAEKPETENEKHMMEEMRELTSLIVGTEGVSQHCFTGWDESYDVILLTNRNFAEVTKTELEELEPGASTRIFGAGVRAKVENLRWVRDLRTYQELLFVIRGMASCRMDAAKAAETIVASDFLNFLNRSHSGKEPYYFRVEFKSKRPLDEKSAFVKKLSGQIEKLSGRKLINTTSNYEVELRLIENKEGNCNLLVKLFTLKDDRFSYRREVIPMSIRPVNAALTVALAKEYMKKDAQVLDPFCGVGTMLIERHKAVAAGSSYGLDILEEAVDKAKINSEAAHQVIHYINRDFFRFTHEYLFDEVITNMPFKMGRTTEDDILELYGHFFRSVKQYLKENATLILYSHNRDHIRQMAGRNGFKVMKECEISKKEGTYVCVLGSV